MSLPPEEQRPEFQPGEPVQGSAAEAAESATPATVEPVEPVEPAPLSATDDSRPTVPYVPVQPAAAQSQPPTAPQQPLTPPRPPRGPLAAPVYTEDLDHEESKAPTIMAGLALAIAVVALLAVIGIIPIGKDSGLINQSDIAPAAVGNDQIADGAVSVAKLDSELAGTVSDPQPGPRGPRGAVGERGPQGKPGEVGPPGPAATAIVTDKAKATASTSSLSAFASCPADEVMVGGGVAVDGSAQGVVVNRSAPDSDGKGWHGSAVETTPTDQIWTLTTYAVCAEQASSAGTGTKRGANGSAPGATGATGATGTG